MRYYQRDENDGFKLGVTEVVGKDWEQRRIDWYKARIYRRLWKEVAEILGKGGEYYIKFEELDYREIGPTQVEYQLEVLLSALTPI